MIFLDTYIDTFQRAKKTWVELYVKEESVAKAMNEFVEAQTQFAKNMTRITDQFVTVAMQPNAWFGSKASK
jgi:hypothetical protein